MSDNYSIDWDVVAQDIAELGYIQTEAVLFAAKIAARYPDELVKCLNGIDAIDLRGAIDQRLKEGK